MKRIIILALCMLNSFVAIAMDAPGRRRSSGRSNTLLARHQRQDSIGEKVFASLTLKTDETIDCSTNLDILAADKRVPEQSLSQESADSLTPSNSRNLTEKAEENNRNNFTKMTLLAFEAIKKIKAVDDTAHKEYKSHIKYAEHYYMSWMSLGVTKDSRALEMMAEEEFKPLQDTFNEKMASLLAQKK